MRFVLTGTTHFYQHKLLAEAPLKTIYEEIAENQEILLQEFVEKSEEPTVDEDEDLEEPYIEKVESIPLREFAEQIAADLDLLESDFIDLDANSDDIILSPDNMRPLTAVIMAALVRYEYHDDQLRSYMFDLTVRD